MLFKSIPALSWPFLCRPSTVIAFALVQENTSGTLRALLKGLPDRFTDTPQIKSFALQFVFFPFNLFYTWTSFSLLYLFLYVLTVFNFDTLYYD